MNSLMVTNQKTLYFNMIIKLLIEYDGTNYCGWQKQKNGVSIQGEIEKSLNKIFNKEINIFVAGRTDAGVHAIGQVAHFDMNLDFKFSKILPALNHHLAKNNNKIIIKKTYKENKNFHSRFSAKERIYEYRIINRKTPRPLEFNREWHIPYFLDIFKMEKAAKLLTGKHDFNGFRSGQCQSSSSIRSIKSIDLKKVGYKITITFRAKSYLHNQVRIMMGSLVNVGRNFWDTEQIKKILNTKKRIDAGPTAPPYGLYLKKIIY